MIRFSDSTSFDEITELTIPIGLKSFRFVIIASCFVLPAQTLIFQLSNNNHSTDIIGEITDVKSTVTDPPHDKNSLMATIKWISCQADDRLLGCFSDQYGIDPCNWLILSLIFSISKLVHDLKQELGLNKISRFSLVIETSHLRQQGNVSGGQGMHLWWLSGQENTRLNDDKTTGLRSLLFIPSRIQWKSGSGMVMKRLR
ncbi:Uncharacterized protein Rs2_06760 [Raphanus sativus]|nr:Uncharacterized protein Rs2_06760 [Raphanus sativus]